MTWNKICKALAECCGGAPVEQTAAQEDPRPPMNMQNMLAGAPLAGAGQPASGAATAKPAGNVPPAKGAGHQYKDSTANGIHSMLADPLASVASTGAAAAPAKGAGHRYHDSTAMGIQSMLKEPRASVPLADAGNAEPTLALNP